MTKGSLQVSDETLVETEEEEAQIQSLEMVGDLLITRIPDAMNTADMIHEE